jgi:hypothetical protein
MQNDAAVFRTQSSLEDGCRNIDETVASFNDVKVRSRSPLTCTQHIKCCQRNACRVVMCDACGVGFLGMPQPCTANLGWMTQVRVCSCSYVANMFKTCDTLVTFLSLAGV